MKPEDDELLLPWLANETLDDSERERIEQFLASHPEQQDELEFLRGLRRGVKQERLGSPGAFGLRRLQQEIRAERAEATGLDAAPPAANDNRWWKMSLAAAALVVMVQGGLLLNLTSSTDDRIRPLSSGQGDVTILQIEFQPAASEQEIRTLLKAVGGRIVDGPSALGLYRIHIDHDESATTDIDAIIDRLRAEEEVIRYAEKN